MYIHRETGISFISGEKPTEDSIVEYYNKAQECVGFKKEALAKEAEVVKTLGGVEWTGLPVRNLLMTMDANYVISGY